MKNIKNYQEFTNEEINWKKGLATAALGASLMGGVTSCGPNKEETKEETKKEQLIEFNRELDNMITPERLVISFDNNIKRTPELTKIYSDPDLYNSQIATFYDSRSKELVDFIIDIMIYKGIIKDRNISISDLQEFIDRIRTNKQDEFDQLILDSFDKIVEYQQKFIEYDRNSGILRKSGSMFQNY